MPSIASNFLHEKLDFFQVKELQVACRNLELPVPRTKDELVRTVRDHAAARIVDGRDLLQAFNNPALISYMRHVGQRPGNKQENVERLARLVFESGKQLETIVEELCREEEEQGEDSADEGSVWWSVGGQAWDAQDEGDDEDIATRDDLDDDMDLGSIVQFRLGVSGVRSDALPLLKHQEIALERLSNWWRSDRNAQPNGVLCLPTGAGKTRTAVSFVLREALKSGWRVLWLAHREELLHGAIREFLRNEGEAKRPLTLSRFEKGRLKDDRPGDIVVASLSTLAHDINGLAANLEQLLEAWSDNEEPLLIVLDECHHAVAPTWHEVLKAFAQSSPRGRFLGLSATPTRTVEAERGRLARAIGRFIHEASMRELIEARVLARPSFEVVSADGVRVQASSSDRAAWSQFKKFSADLVDRLVSARGFNQVVLKTYQRRNWGPTVIFAATKEHARKLARTFSDAGVRTGCVLSGAETSREDRREVIEAFKRGGLDVLVNVNICSEGTDLPNAQTVFIARPTRSRIDVQQMIGRAMRGPDVGGTATCNAVLFYADIVGLVDEVLHSTYSSRAEIEAAVGYDVPAVPVAPSAVPTPPAAPQAKALASNAEADRRLEELERLVEGMDLTVPCDLSVLPNDLVGWWEAWSGEERSYIAVFREDQAAIAAEVQQLLRQKPMRESYAAIAARGSAERMASLRWVSPARWEEFARLVVFHLGQDRFTEVMKASPEDLGRLKAGGGPLPAKTHVTEVAPPSPPLPERIAEFARSLRSLPAADRGAAISNALSGPFADEFANREAFLEALLLSGH